MARSSQVHRAVLIGLALTVALALLCGLQRLSAARWLDPVETVERLSLDVRFKLRGPVPARGDVVLVAFDDRTLERAPDLFELRSGTARVLAAIDRAKPAVVGLDLLFADPERLLSPELSDRIKALVATPPAGAASVERALLEEVAGELRGDERLAAAMEGGGELVLALHLGVRGEALPDDPALAKGRYGQSVYGPQLPEAVPRGLSSLPMFTAAADGLGVVTMVEDQDQTVRELRFAVRAEDRVYAPFPAVLVARYQGVPRAMFTYLGSTGEVGIGDLRVPLDPGDSLVINYRGPAGSFPTYSAVDVLEGAVPAAALADKIVLVGHTYLGHDRVRTPFGAGTPGVELHASVIDSLLAGDLIRRASPWQDTLACVVAGALVALLFLPGLTPLARVLGVAGVALLYASLAAALFVLAGLWLAVAWPLATIIGVGAVGLSRAYLREAVARRRLRRTFANYLGDDALRELLADPRALELGGERRRLSVLFSDIRGFTEVAERLEPERLVALLNTYLTPMTRAVLARGGYLDKYIGDAVMAVYGAPVRCEDHVARALSTAVDMHRALVGLSGQLEETLSMGIGINTGEVVVGNMGATERFDYTAIGDAVNLASRLEGLTRVYDVQCLVGAETRAAAPASYQFREIDLVRVKGKERPVAVHELLAGPEGQIVEYAALDRFAAGLAAYRAGELAAARAAFAAFAEKNPADAVAKLYLERLAALGDAAPAGWDGVFSFTRK